MYNEISKIIMYGQLDKESILKSFGRISRKIAEKDEIFDKESLISEIYKQIYKILDLSTKYGFDRNLWQCYIAYILGTNENPFSIICEKEGASKDASVNLIVNNDMESFYNLFNFDFSKWEEELDIDCFSIITNYHSMAKKEKSYNKGVSQKINYLADELSKAEDKEKFFIIISDFYKKYGVGNFGLNKAFRIIHPENDIDIELQAIPHTSDVKMDNLIGYESQKELLISNTEKFLKGKPANNVLLYGDSGTGKSTSIKALLNEYYDQGLRLIEIYKHQFKDLPKVMAKIKDRNYKFIIYMDDLSFEEFEIDYKYLKAVIEGGIEIRPDNVLIYATSNRRHLIRETWSDRSDMSQDDLHHSDTMQEKLSLVARFGLSINYSKPNKKEYDNIVLELAKNYPEIKIPKEELLIKASAWSIRNGGYTGRAAEQFIISLLSNNE